MKKVLVKFFPHDFRHLKKYQNFINSVIFAGPQNLLKTKKKKKKTSGNGQKRFDPVGSSEKILLLSFTRQKGKIM